MSDIKQITEIVKKELERKKRLSQLAMQSRQRHKEKYTEYQKQYRQRKRDEFNNAVKQLEQYLSSTISVLPDNHINSTETNN